MMNFTKKTPIIVLIAGKSGAGKDTVAKYLKEEFIKKDSKVVLSPYTKYLKKYIEEITNTKIDENNKPRDYLQKISSYLIKDKLKKEDFFINRQIEDIEIYSYFMDAILIPDVRFPKEIDVIKEKFPNVYSILIERKNYISTLTEEQQCDITENALKDYQGYDFKIVNTDLVTLKEEVIKIFKKINERGNINE